LAGTASTKVAWQNKDVDAICREYGGDFPQDLLVSLYPVLVSGQINPRLLEILRNRDETDVVKWTAFSVLVQDSFLLRERRSELQASLKDVHPEDLRAKMFHLLGKLVKENPN
jgi:hypothetical protein